MVTVAIAAVLSTIAAPTYNRFRRRAMTSEVHENLDNIARGSAVYFYAEHFDTTGVPVPHQFPGKIAVDSASSDCCTQSNGICSGGPWRWSSAAWQALHFSVDGDHRYRYRYQSWNDDADARYRATATGDLDCDGIQAVWTQQGWADVIIGIRLVQERILPDNEIE